MSVVKEVVASIKAGKFDERLAAHLEAGGLALVDAFRKETLGSSKKEKLCDTEQQLAVFFCYLKRIVAAFGVEEIRPWSALILGSLSDDHATVQPHQQQQQQQHHSSQQAQQQHPTLELLANTTASLVQLVMQKETALTNAQAATIASSTSASANQMASPIPISSSHNDPTSSPTSSSATSTSSASLMSSSVGTTGSESNANPHGLVHISTSLSPTLLHHNNSSAYQYYPFHYGGGTGGGSLALAIAPTPTPTTAATTTTMLGTSLPPISATLSPEKLYSLGLNPTSASSSPSSSSSSSSSSTSSSAGLSPSSSLTTQGVSASLPLSGSGSNINTNNAANNSFRQKVFNLYFTRRSSTVERILLDYADSQTFVSLHSTPSLSSVSSPLPFPPIVSLFSLC